jgi:hypothetical protein
MVEGGLIAHWDGASWSTVPAPGSGPRGSHLTDVIALSANDAWAVGSWFDRFSYAHTLTIHWDGVAWSVVPSPEHTADGALANYLEGVSAATPNDIWAVGSYNNDPQTYSRSLLLHWNGSAWSLVPSPTNEFTFNYPLDVAALSETDAWAVGLAVDTGGRTLVEHWDGDAWSVVEDADLASRANLVGIDAISPTNIWAVGNQDNPSNSSQLRSLVEWWDGDAWNLVPSANMFNGEQNVSTALEAVAAIASRDVWAVGAYLHGHGNLPGEPEWAFSMHYSTGSCATATPIPTATPTITPVPVSTVVGCGLEFADVPPGDTFYPYARCLTCKGSISGYACGGTNPVTGEPEPCDQDRKPYFRPGNPVSRGQIAKMVSQSAGFNEPAGQQIYEDVPPGSPFYDFVQRLSHRAVMGGYPCGQPDTEPCVAPANRPNFRPDALATRGHISKIVSNAAGFEDEPTTQKFEDVPPANPFYVWVERLGSREVMGGYPCGTVADEPCVEPDDRPYFRYGRTVTRGQAAKIVSNTFFPNCDLATPTPAPLATVTPTAAPAPARKVR